MLLIITILLTVIWMIFTGWEIREKDEGIVSYILGLIISALWAWVITG